MNHDFYGPAWADNHARLGEEFTRFFGMVSKAVAAAFDRLHAYQYDAPWRRPARRIRIRAER
ncbi:hypothetical protein [Hephaestia mangrovi]|uniref:hypothetical protein n=1 Tax=Hephaestia mangrovi TaxID=2873268 RepID=UPI001CA63DBD|nr:hypothetical protein [Hephaestia mangrovi]MBY8828766.1 hypothetical protein [Hephaestia mangrovi]